jgi:mono/diheme cytochrome c family protein
MPCEAGEAPLSRPAFFFYPSLADAPGVESAQNQAEPAPSASSCCQEAAMRRSLLVLGAFLLAGGGVFTARQNNAQEKPKEPQEAATDAKMTPEDAARKNPVPVTPEGLAEARSFYKYQCAMCHGENGDGKGDLADVMKLKLNNWRDASSLAGKTDGELYFILTKGKGQMLGNGDRTKEDMRWKLVNLVRSFAKKDSKEKPAPESPNS